MRSRAYEQMRKRLVNAAKAKRIPILGHFELTARCNLDCKMCYVHTQNNELALKNELSTEQWIRIFDEAYEAGMLYATLSGGECLIRKDFRELYLHLWNKQVMITVMTNGTLLNEEYVQFFKTYKPEMVQISIYGSNEEGYINLAGHKGFEKAVTAAKKLMEADIDVRMVVTPNKYMLDDYLNILKTCKELGLPLSAGDILLSPNRDDPTKDDYFLTQEETLLLMKQRAEFMGKKPVPAEAPAPCGPMDQAPGKGLSCNAGNCLFTILWNGRMHPCTNAIVGEGASVLEMSIAEAWEKTKAAADGIAQAVECIGCAYEKICSKCPQYMLKDMHSGHCNPNMCEMSRNLVAAGIKKLGQVATEPHE